MSRTLGNLKCDTRPGPPGSQPEKEQRGEQPPPIFSLQPDKKHLRNVVQRPQTRETVLRASDLRKLPFASALRRCTAQVRTLFTASSLTQTCRRTVNRARKSVFLRTLSWQAWDFLRFPKHGTRSTHLRFIFFLFCDDHFTIAARGVKEHRAQHLEEVTRATVLLSAKGTQPKIFAKH